MEAKNVILITGGSGGIGFEMASILSKNPKNMIVIASRTESKNHEAVNKLKSETPGASVTSLKLDLNSMSSVKEFAQQFLAQYDRLDCLFCNAGLLTASYSLSPDGFESSVATNHLGHFLLIQLLLKLIVKTSESKTGDEKARIILTSSYIINPKNFSLAPYPNIKHGLKEALLPEMPKDYDSIRAVSNAKLLGALSMHHLAQLYPKIVVSVYDPGFVTGTEVSRGMSTPLRFVHDCILPVVMKPFWKRVSSVQRSAKFMAHLAEHSTKTGTYYSVDSEEDWVDLVNDKVLKENIWNESLEVVGKWIE